MKKRPVAVLLHHVLVALDGTFVVFILLRDGRQLQHPASLAAPAPVQRPRLNERPGKVAPLHLQPQQQLGVSGFFGVLLSGRQQQLLQRIKILLLLQAHFAACFRTKGSCASSLLHQPQGFGQQLLLLPGLGI